MRPAVYASIARNRKSDPQRIRLRAPTFSSRTLIVMIFVGGIIFIPGITLTVLGLEEVHGSQNFSPAQRVLYKMIGPAAVAIGVLVLISSIIYYFCYGVANPTPTSRHPSSGSAHHPPSAYSSIRSTHTHDSQDKNGDTKLHHKKRHGSGSSNASERYHHHHHHGHHHHRRNTSQGHEVNNLSSRKQEPEEVSIKIQDENECTEDVKVVN